MSDSLVTTGCFFKTHVLNVALAEAIFKYVYVLFVYIQEAKIKNGFFETWTHGVGYYFFFHPSLFYLVYILSLNKIWAMV